jgi:hypothetical protein
MTLLAVRCIGPYYDYSSLPPFSASDEFWPRIAAYAERRDLAYRRLPIAIPYDDPTLADGIRRSGRFSFEAGPPVQIF